MSLEPKLENQYLTSLDKFLVHSSLQATTTMKPSSTSSRIKISKSSEHLYVSNTLEKTHFPLWGLIKTT